jgi:MHS family proline/betaine transporter-like MFS transporter
LIYLTEWFGAWGLWFVFIPSTIGFFIGVRHFEKLEFNNIPLTGLSDLSVAT